MRAPAAPTALNRSSAEKELRRGGGIHAWGLSTGSFLCDVRCLLVRLILGSNSSKILHYTDPEIVARRRGEAGPQAPRDQARGMENLIGYKYIGISAGLGCSPKKRRPKSCTVLYSFCHIFIYVVVSLSTEFKF